MLPLPLDNLDNVQVRGELFLCPSVKFKIPFVLLPVPAVQEAQKEYNEHGASNWTSIREIFFHLKNHCLIF